ncbi:MAG: HlyD family efflux transporter periplasmic adaptor subunit [Oscillospiraceae bacterium]
MKRIVEIVLISGVALVVLLVGGFNLYRYFSNPIQVEAVIEYSVPSRRIGRGIAIRQEQTIPRTGSGTIGYIYSDGAKVSVDSPVVEYYSTAVNDQNLRRMREIETEIAMLEEAQNKSTSTFANMDVINRDIRDRLGALGAMGSTGRCDTLQTTRDELILLMNKRQVAIGKDDSFTSRISELNAEYASLTSSAGAEQIQLEYTPSSGYFSRNVDSFTGNISPDDLDDLTVSDYLQYINQEPRNLENYAGKIVTNQRWYFAAAMPVYDTDGFYVGQSLYLTFDQVEDTIPAKVWDIVAENNNDTAVVVFRSDVISEDIVNLRTSDVTVSFLLSQHTGIRISSSSLRFQNNEATGEMEMGVFVLENRVVRFKKVDPVYTEQGFILSRTVYPNSGKAEDEGYVCLFDQVIVQGGNELYDGKIVR